MTDVAVPVASPATAADDARRVADAAGVRIEHLHDVEPMQQVVALFVDVWQTRLMDPPVNRDLLRALAHAGGYVAAAYAGEDLVAGSVGFFAADGSLHSHISGVRLGLQSRGVGRALKLDQRAWCLERGVGRITWTFDPLVRRNAWFNLAKLGATCDEYLPEFYGSMKDGVNAGDASDRLFATWDLLSGRAAAAAAGELPELDAADLLRGGARVALEDVDDRPVAHVGSTAERTPLLVGTPLDVIKLRVSDRDAAVEWRKAVRDALEPAVAAGYRVSGMTRTGYYVLTPKDGGTP